MNGQINIIKQHGHWKRGHMVTLQSFKNVNATAKPANRKATLKCALEAPFFPGAEASPAASGDIAPAHKFQVNKEENYGVSFGKVC